MHLDTGNTGFMLLCCSLVMLMTPGLASFYGGFLGIILCGAFATTAFNPNGVDGLVRGNTHFFLMQCLAVAISSAWAFCFTLGMLKVIDMITPVKVGEGTEEVGLDAGIHGEKAYLEEGI